MKTKRVLHIVWFSGDKTKSLSDDEINPVMEEVIKELEEKFGAELRK